MSPRAQAMADALYAAAPLTLDGKSRSEHQEHLKIEDTPLPGLGLNDKIRRGISIDD
jgi:hypothetical protein